MTDDEREQRLADRDRLAAARVQLRAVPAARLGLPSRVEMWRGDRCLGFIFGTAEGIEVVANSGRLRDEAGREAPTVRVAVLPRG